MSSTDHDLRSPPDHAGQQPPQFSTTTESPDDYYRPYQALADDFKGRPDIVVTTRFEDMAAVQQQEQQRPMPRPGSSHARSTPRSQLRSASGPAFSSSRLSNARSHPTLSTATTGAAARVKNLAHRFEQAASSSSSSGATANNTTTTNRSSRDARSRTPTLTSTTSSPQTATPLSPYSSAGRARKTSAASRLSPTTPASVSSTSTFPSLSSRTNAAPTTTPTHKPKHNDENKRPSLSTQLEQHQHQQHYKPLFGEVTLTESPTVAHPGFGIPPVPHRAIPDAVFAQSPTSSHFRSQSHDEPALSPIHSSFLLPATSSSGYNHRRSKSEASPIQETSPPLESNSFITGGLARLSRALDIRPAPSPPGSASPPHPSAQFSPPQPAPTSHSTATTSPPPPPSSQWMKHTTTASRIPVSAARRPSHERDLPTTSTTLPPSTLEPLQRSPSPSKQTFAARQRTAPTPPPASQRSTTPTGRAGLGVKRYHASPRPITTAHNPSLQAYIAPQSDPVSPPLRGSRQRTPVSEASTAASRARLTQRTVDDTRSPTSPRPGSRTQQHHSDRGKLKKPPDIASVNLEERRANIERAMTISRQESVRRRELEAKKAKEQRESMMMMPMPVLREPEQYQQSKQQQEVEVSPTTAEPVKQSGTGLSRQPSAGLPIQIPSRENSTLKEENAPRLSLQVQGLTSRGTPEPKTGQTEFEEDSPILGMPGVFPAQAGPSPPMPEDEFEAPSATLGPLGARDSQVFPIEGGGVRRGESVLQHVRSLRRNSSLSERIGENFFDDTLSENNNPNRESIAIILGATPEMGKEQGEWLSHPMPSDFHETQTSNSPVSRRSTRQGGSFFESASARASSVLDAFDNMPIPGSLGYKRGSISTGCSDSQGTSARNSLYVLSAGNKESPLDDLTQTQIPSSQLNIPDSYMTEEELDAAAGTATIYPSQRLSQGGSEFSYSRKSPELHASAGAVNDHTQSSARGSASIQSLDTSSTLSATGRPFVPPLEQPASPLRGLSITGATPIADSPTVPDLPFLSRQQPPSLPQPFNASQRTFLPTHPPLSSTQSDVNLPTTNSLAAPGADFAQSATARSSPGAGAVAQSSNSGTGSGAAPSPLLNGDNDSSRQPSIDGVNATNEVSVEEKRLKRRYHIIKELVDTEHSYISDMTVIEDIYKATAHSGTLTDDDIRILFGNSRQILVLANELESSLKAAAKPIYVLPSAVRWRRGSYSTSTSHSEATDQSSLSGKELAYEEKDRMTSVGQAFLNHVEDMGRVYRSYCKNHGEANRLLSKLEKREEVRNWTRECASNARDLTSAWNLDALIIKPTQRILKYPLLLRSIIEQTPEDHPDYDSLIKAEQGVKDAAKSIDEYRERAETIQNIISGRTKPRKDSNIKSAFRQRKAEFKQNAGMAEHVEDWDYVAISEKFGGFFMWQQVIVRDAELYVKSATETMEAYVNFVDAMDGVLDVQRSGMAEVESKWRQFAMVIRQLKKYAFPEHVASVNRNICKPVLSLIKLLERPQHLMEKRKRLIFDYARYKAALARGEKGGSGGTMDKGLEETGMQWIKLNEALKDELPKLYSLSKDLAIRVLEVFAQLQIDWAKTVESKLLPLFEGTTPELDLNTIMTNWKHDFSFADNEAHGLAIVNGQALNDLPANLLGSTPSLPNSLAGSTLVPDSASAQSRRSATREYRNGSFTSDPPTGGYSPGIPSSYSFPKFEASPHLPNGHMPLPPNTRLRAGSASAGVTPNHGRPPMAGSGHSGYFPHASQQQQPPSSSSSHRSHEPTPASSGTNTQRQSLEPPPRPRPQSHEITSPPPSSTATGPAPPVGTPSLGSPLTPGYSTIMSPSSVTSDRPPVLSSSALPPANFDRSNSDFSASFAQHFEGQTINDFAPRTSQSQSQSHSTRQQVQDADHNRRRERERGSGVFSSALPMDDARSSGYDPSTATKDVEEAKVMFLAASLFEFNIDRRRREAGYPYLTYVQGEVFDVIGQKGELWLAKNQDDATGLVGWIWEKHFVKLPDEAC